MITKHHSGSLCREVALIGFFDVRDVDSSIIFIIDIYTKIEDVSLKVSVTPGDGPPAALGENIGLLGARMIRGSKRVRLLISTPRRRMLGARQGETLRCCSNAAA